MGSQHLPEQVEEYHCKNVGRDDGVRAADGCSGLKWFEGYQVLGPEDLRSKRYPNLKVKL